MAVAVVGAEADLARDAVEAIHAGTMPADKTLAMAGAVVGARVLRTIKSFETF